MKNIICFLIMVLSFHLAAAQIEKNSENTWKLPASKRVSLDLKFGQNIKVSTWAGNEVKLKTFLQVSKEEFAKIHTIKVTEIGDELQVKTDYDFKEEKKYRQHDCNCFENWDTDCVCVIVRLYEVLVPVNTILHLETISGDIEIKGLPSELSAKSISGFVDLSLQSNAKADLNFKSVTGEIYSDFDVKLDAKSTSYSKRLSATINGGGARVALETVSGDIFFRKVK